jgi:hypothetical protein
MSFGVGRPRTLENMRINVARVLFLAFSFGGAWATGAARGEVLYLTDVEGSRRKLEAAFRRSGDFVLEADGFWRLLPGKRFVYGGDAPDRFHGSLWVTEQLARLVEAAPDRAIVLVGNRDANKLRLPGELAPEALAAAPPWFVWAAVRAFPPATPASRPERLRWILRHTLTPIDIFENRRRELAGADAPAWVEPLRQRLASRLGRPVPPDDDELVVESFLYELEPGGPLRRLLERSRLSWREGNTLFVHGGISRWNFGRVPDRSTVILSVDRWQAALDRWYHERLDRWAREPHATTGDSRRAAEEILHYMMPIPGTRSNRRSVVTGRSTDGENMPWLPPVWVRETLRDQGIDRIVVGHTPAGDVPSVVRTPDGKFEVLCADNSYGFREDAATLLRIRDDAVSVEGTFRDGTPEGTSVRFEAPLGRPSPLGAYTPDGELVVGVENGVPEARALLYQMAQFRVSYRWVPVSSLTDLRVAEPPETLRAPVRLVGAFDPPTLADRSRIAAFLERSGMERVFVDVLPDGPGIVASRAHRREMARRAFADMPHDVVFEEVERTESPFELPAVALGTLPDPFGETLTGDERSFSAETPLHPDVAAWIAAHGLYERGNACADAIAFEPVSDAANAKSPRQ